MDETSLDLSVEPADSTSNIMRLISAAAVNHEEEDSDAIEVISLRADHVLRPSMEYVNGTAEIGVLTELIRQDSNESTIFIPLASPPSVFLDFTLSSVLQHSGQQQRELRHVPDVDEFFTSTSSSLSVLPRPASNASASSLEQNDQCVPVVTDHGSHARPPLLRSNIQRYVGESSSQRSPDNM